METLFLKTIDRIRIPISWRRLLEEPDVLKGYFNKVILCTYNRLSTETCILTSIVAKAITKRVKKSGFLSTALYLKNSRVALQMAYGGDKFIPLGFPVGCTRTGYPTMIHVFHRQKIRPHNHESNILVRLYLSIFSLGRIVPLAKSITRKTYSTIVDLPSDIDKMLSTAYDLKQYYAPLISRYLPSIRTIPLYQGITLDTLKKAYPNSIYLNMMFQIVVIPFYKECLEQILKGVEIKGFLNDKYMHKITSWWNKFKMRVKDTKCIEPLFIVELVAWINNLQYVDAIHEADTSPGILWPQRTRYALDPMNKIYSGLDRDEFELNIRDKIQDVTVQLPPLAGRLVCSLEGDGKRRIFAISNYVSQRLLLPLHDWSMSVLRTIMMDGTYDQLKPFFNLKGRSCYYCYDLKAATDRFPVIVIHNLIRYMFDNSFASSCVYAGLYTHAFRRLPKDKESPKYKKSVKRKTPYSSYKSDEPDYIRFSTGQPLGLLSSWSLFSLSHHFVVWCAAEKAYPGRHFTDYCLLGDDLMICDSLVAKEYLAIINDLGISISKEKSLISTKHFAGEFCKQFYLDKLTVNCSPVSPKLLVRCHHPYSLIQLKDKCDISDLKVLSRLKGTRFKERSKPIYLHRKFNFVFQYLRKNECINLSYWLGGGKPLLPHLMGMVVQKVKDSLQPKELHPFPQGGLIIPIAGPEMIRPFAMFQTADDLVFFVEKTFTRSRMKSYLRYLHWYCTTVLNPTATLEELLDNPPVYDSSWLNSPLPDDLVRINLLWKIYRKLFFSLRKKSFYIPALEPLKNPIIPLSNLPYYLILFLFLLLNKNRKISKIKYNENIGSLVLWTDGIQTISQLNT